MNKEKTSHEKLLQKLSDSQSTVRELATELKREKRIVDVLLHPFDDMDSMT